jgi:carboxylesterase type B
MLLVVAQFILALTQVSATPTKNSSLEIQLTTGAFRGFTVAGSGVDQWLGIPFAEPPIGPLRFKAPVPITVPGEGAVVKNATQFGNACPQLDDDGLGPPNAPISEDCLFLNVSLV